jgi:hypothetical protein
VSSCLLCRLGLLFYLIFLLISLRLVEINAEHKTLKALVENAVAFFHPDDPSLAAQAQQLVDGLSTRSRELFLTNMRQLAGLTLGILMTLYPQAELDAAGEDFAVTYTDEEASKLVEDSTVMAGQIVEMLPVDMS